jgi:hypothetical protein
MTLNIPPEQGVEILKKRKREIYIASFEPNVWVGKTENDLVEIFGILDGKKYQISQIRFTTPVSSMKYEILEKGKKQADQFLESYIEQIEEYSKIEKKKYEESEEYFKIENSKLVSDYNKLLNDAKLIEIEKNQFLKKVESQNQKIQSLEKNTVQLTDITIKKIIMLISHLPISEVITFISIFLAIIGFSFWIGTTVQENLNKNEQFNSNKIISTQSDSITDLKIVLKSTVLEKQNIKKQLDSIRGLKK